MRRTDLQIVPASIPVMGLVTMVAMGRLIAYASWVPTILIVDTLAALKAPVMLL
ncbi:MAG: hypothetical protein NT027_09040 [Proteobacteria bacterium]|nr:hypothetical protein [Pseudomonadota bacterium]